jgi:hypothetical protein
MCRAIKDRTGSYKLIITSHSRLPHGHAINNLKIILLVIGSARSPSCAICPPRTTLKSSSFMNSVKREVAFQGF